MFIGLACNGTFATVATPLSKCTNPIGSMGRVTSKLITLLHGDYSLFPSQERTTITRTAFSRSARATGHQNVDVECSLALRNCNCGRVGSRRLQMIDRTAVQTSGHNR